MKKFLLAFSLLLIMSEAMAQVTKLSNNKSLNGFVLNDRIFLISDVDDSLWTSDGTTAGTKIFTTKVSRDKNGGSTVFKNKFYFAGTSDANGSELLVTDGTDAGTKLIKDIIPGTGSSSPRGFFILNDNTLLFSAKTYDKGFELWRTDGTAQGTYMVKDINPGAGNSSEGGFSFKNYNGYAYFFADDGTNGSSLWKTDGTNEGTQFIKDINTQSSNSGNGGFQLIYKNLLFFTIDDGIHGSEMWTTDGTAGGTKLFKDIAPGKLDAVIYEIGESYLNGNFLFLNYPNLQPYPTLWTSDGTASGTKQIEKDSKNGDLYTQDLNNSVLIADKLIFVNPASIDTQIGFVTGNELWITDGSSAKIFLKSVYSEDTFPSPEKIYFLKTSTTPYPYFNFIKNPYYSFDKLWKGKAFFTFDDNKHGSELWETDGTESGTKLFKDIIDGSSASFSSFPNAFFTKDVFFFVAKSSEAIGNELFQSDGTSEGTFLLKDINPGAASSDISFQFIYKNQLYFSANDGDNSDGYYDLYKIDIPVTPLPVTLFDFAATLQPSQAVDLTWSTATEMNSDHFEVERSFDGVAFGKITSVFAAGNSSLQKKYSYTDEQAAHIGKQMLYYRLKMVDKDGSYKYSGVLRIHLKNLLTLSLSPNPVVNQLNVLVNTRGSHNIQLRITDASGKYLYQKTLPVNGDVYQHSINVASLHKGIYYVQVVTDKQTKTERFVKP